MMPYLASAFRSLFSATSESRILMSGRCIGVATRKLIVSVHRLAIVGRSRQFVLTCQLSSPKFFEGVLGNVVVVADSVTSYQRLGSQCGAEALEVKSRANWSTCIRSTRH